jgi:hypothetical protein
MAKRPGGKIRARSMTFWSSGTFPGQSKASNATISVFGIFEDQSAQRHMWDHRWYDRFEIPRTIPADVRRGEMEMGGERFGAVRDPLNGLRGIVLKRGWSKPQGSGPTFREDQP